MRNKHECELALLFEVELEIVLLERLDFEKADEVLVLLSVAL